MTTNSTRNIDCPCGEEIKEADDDALVAAVQAHLKSKHPQLSYDRSQILMMAY